MTILGHSPGKGRGIFATEDIAPGVVIEVCPVIPLSPEDRSHIEKTALYDYFYSWGDDGKGAAVCLGNGSVYNHDYHPNARYDKDFEAGTVTFVAIRPIGAGDEITTNYNGHPHDQTRVWFETL